MAYVVPTMTDEEEKKKNEATGSSVVGSTAQSSIIPSAGSSGSGAVSGTQQQAAPKRSATGFTNFGTYLQANQGQGQRMANDRADDIQAEAAQTKANIDRDTTQFLQGQGVYDQSGNLNTQKFDTKNLQKDFGSTDFTNVNQQDFNKLYNQSSNAFGQFKPTNERPTYDYLKDPNAVKNQAESFAGRTAELQQEYGKGNSYGRGLQNLDAFLLGQSDLGQQKAKGVQQTIDYAKAGQGSGLNLIDKSMADYANAAKFYDQNVAQSRDAYQQAYNKQLGDLGSQFSNLKTQAAGLKPNVNLFEVDAQGNIMSNSLTPRKADQVFRAPNGKQYTVVSDTSAFDQISNPLQSAYDRYSKVAGLTNQKVEQLPDYKSQYNAALESAKKNLIDQYLAQNQPLATLNRTSPQSKPDIMVGGAPISAGGSGSILSQVVPTPISIKDGKTTFNKNALVPVGAKETVATTKKVGEGATSAAKKLNPIVQKATVAPTQKALSTLGISNKKGSGTKAPITEQEKRLGEALMSQASEEELKNLGFKKKKKS